MAEEYELPFLGQIPLVQSIRECGDAGKPIAVDENSISSLAFIDLAQKVVDRVEFRNNNMEATKQVEMKK